MARWTRAARLMTLPSSSRVLDLGCAFGFGTRMLTRRYDTHGHDLSLPYIERARRSVPAATFTQGSADAIPPTDAYFDGVVFLDVLEHVPDERAVIEEIARVLRPGGQLILSVPNKGILSALDSLNIYHRLLGADAPAPTDDPSWSSSPQHRHYTVDDIQALLGGRFLVRAVHYSGLGLAEPINLVLLLLFRALLKMPRVYDVLQYLYFGVYLAEDMIPTGSYGYHMMIDAERL